MSVDRWFPLILVAMTAAAQQGPNQVGVTQAVSHQMRQSVSLPGTVVARSESLVASEVQGLVVKLNVHAGDRVKAGAVIAELRRKPLELMIQSQEASLKEAESRLKLAEINLERADGLLRTEVFSQQQYDEKLYETQAWEGRAAQIRADLASTLDDLERSEITAPFAGAVIRKHTDLGQWLAVGDPVVELVDMNSIQVEVDLPERYFTSVSRGDPAVIEIASLERVSLQGRIQAVIPKADAQARTFPVKVEIVDSDPGLGVGMLAEVVLKIGDPFDAVIVPKDAIVQQGSRRVVHVVRAGKVVAETVRMGAAVGVWQQVEANVAAGDEVVTRGNERLRPGMEVETEAVEYPTP